MASGSLTEHFRFRIHAIHRIPVEWMSNHNLFSMQVCERDRPQQFSNSPFPPTQVALYYGGQRLHAPTELHTSSETGRGWFNSVFWPVIDDELWASVPVPLKELPRETRIVFVVRGATTEKVSEDLRDRACRQIQLPSFSLVLLTANPGVEAIGMGGLTFIRPPWVFERWPTFVGFVDGELKLSLYLEITISPITTPLHKG